MSAGATIANDDSPMCAIHREELAGWRCDDAACRKHLCEKCTSKTVNQYNCCTCGAAASQLVVPRSAKPFSVWVGKAVLYPLRTGPLLVIAAAFMIAIIAFVADKIGDFAVWSTILRGGVVLALALAVADSAARGDISETGAAARLGRAFAATAIVWVPAGVYLWALGIPANGFGADRMLWLLAGLALVYLPIAIGAAVTDASVGDVVNPFKLFELAWQLGRRYWITLITVALLAGATLAIGRATVDKIRAAVTVPVVGELAAVLPMLAVIAVLAYMIGLMSFVHGDRLGWADAPQYADPLHPKMVAQGKRKAAPAADTTSADATAALAERNDVRKINDYMKEDNFARALKLYESRPSWAATAFDEGKLLLLAKAAARSKKPDLAKQIFEEIIARNGRSAGHALVGLAQVHADTGDAAKASALYRQTMEQFPNSEAAKVASLKLKVPGAL